MSSTVPGILWPWKQLTTTSNFSQLTTKPSTSVILTTTTRTSSPLASTTTSTSTSTSSSSSSSYDAYYDDEDYTDYNDYLFSNLSESSSSISLPVPSSSAFAAASSSEDPVLHSAPSSFLSSLYSGSYNSTAHLDSLNASAAEEYWTRNDSAMTASAAGEDEFAELWNCTTCLFLSYDNGSVGGGSADLSGNLSAFNISDNLNLNLTGESGSGVDKESTVYLIEVLATSIILGFLILATVIGNVFVIIAILLDRNLKSVANNLILSLAVADLLVACLVMPFGAVYEVSKEWKMGPELCDMWTSCDVLCCTASILHLVAIALDRYWAVTDIDYAHQRTSKRIGIMIFVIWLLSLLVSIAPLLGWKDPEWNDRIINDLQCIVSQDLGYQIFATASSFYVPLLVILFLYWKIFLTARKRIRRRQQVTGAQQKAASATSMIATAAAASGGIAGIAAVIGRPLPTISEATTTTTTTAFTNASSANTSPVKGGGGGGGDRNGVDIEGDQPTMDNISMAYPSMAPPPPSKPARKKPQQALDSKRERKAAKTLVIITGAFVCCWLPFFILAIILPTCKEQCNISQFMISVCLWLGYFNSTLNPIIYTIFSPEFRHAFKKILCRRRRRISRERNLRNLRYLVS